MNTSESIRFKSISDHLTARTRLQANEIELVSDVQTEYGITIECQQLVSIETKISTSSGKSGASLLSDVNLLPGAAKTEAQRLSAALPDRIKNWLGTAPRNVGEMPRSKVFDFDAGSYGHDVACTQCDCTGQLPCTGCGSTGICNCEGCKGIKIITCPICKGNCEHLCSTCHGSTTVKCSKCDGVGNTRCYACYGAKTQNCSSCSGRGYFTRYQGGVQVPDPCGSCGASGKVPCLSCIGYGELLCNSCSRGKVRCQTCSGSGNENCATCSAFGNIACPTCKGIGHLKCQHCKGKSSIDCQKCGASGWNHSKAQVFAKLEEKEGITFAHDIPDAISARVKALFSILTQSGEGNFKSLEQNAIDGVAPGLRRAWSGSFPIWEMVIRIGANRYTLYAIGNSQNVGDLSALTNSVLEADRIALKQAFQGKSVESADAALKTYFLSTDHQRELLAYQSDTSSLVREDVKDAFDYLIKKRNAALRKWKLIVLIGIAVVLAAVLTRVRFAYDWAILALTPLVILLAGGMFASASACESTVLATGNEEFSSKFNASGEWKWRISGLFWKGVFWGLLIFGCFMAVNFGKPMFLQKKITEIKLRANAMTDKAGQIRASQEIIQRVLLCGAHDLDVYTALKLLEQEKMLTYLPTDKKDEEVVGISWYLANFKLFDRPVLQISYFHRFDLDNKFGMRTDLAVHLKNETNDPTTLIKQLDIPFKRVANPYLKQTPKNLNEGRFRYSNGDAVLTTELSKFIGYRDSSNYSKPPQTHPMREKDLYTITSLAITCSRTKSVLSSKWWFD